MIEAASISDDEIKVLFIRLGSGLVVGVTYRPPRSAVETFLCKFEAIPLTLFDGHRRRTVVVVDFNINFVCDTNVNNRLVLESLILNNLIIEPTGITSTSCTLIDHVLCDINTGVCAGLYTDPLTDNFPVFVVFQNNCFVTPSRRAPYPTLK